jgi:hypothetical protein
MAVTPPAIFTSRDPQSSASVKLRRRAAARSATIEPSKGS